VAPHVHAQGVNANAPHDPGGSTDGRGAVAPFMLAWSAVDQWLAASPPTVLPPLAASAPPAIPRDAVERARPHSRPQPRGPPTVA
jgi:hypothetical protein